tara:strand:- start:284 stop:1426 length:1143 start_codon:yes stop_codon:yes gene_type:complete
MSKAAELAALIANVNKGSSLANKNLIINGGMTVAQRSSSAVAVSDGSNENYQTLDRFRFLFANSAGGACNISQDTDVPSGYGFTNSYKVDVTTADTSISATHMISIAHRVEAQNIANCGWVHNSSSSYMTLSFWAKSVKAGTYCVSIDASDSSSTRKFVKEYTLVANTWKKVEITFAGESGVTVNNDTGIGLDIRWTLQVGADRDNATDNTWNSSDTSIGTSNQVNFFDDGANNFFLTGVMLEVGEKASPQFEHEPFETTLAKCQRYFCKSYDYEDAVGTATQVAGIYQRQPASSVEGAVSNRAVQIRYPVELRGEPTATVYSLNGTSGAVSDCGTGYSHGSDDSGCFFNGTDGTSGLSKITGTSGDSMIGFHFTADAEL